MKKKTQNSLFIFLTKRYKHKLPRIQRNSRLGSIKSREQKKIHETFIAKE